jgi:nucleoside-diphosphate-sugar epimerase
VNALITGFAGPIGQALAARLMRDNPFGNVVGIGRRPPELLGPVRFVSADVREADLGDLILMNGVQVVIHLAWAGEGPGGPRAEHKATKALLEVAELAGVERVVLPSRDWVYARSQSSWCAEDAPLRASGMGGSLRVDAKLRVEAEVRSLAARAPSTEVVVVRTSGVLGAGRGSQLDDVLAAPVFTMPSSGDPLVQFLHVDDAAEVFLACATQPGLSGAVNAAGPEPLPLSVVAGVLEKRTVRPPRWLWSTLRRTRLLGFAPSELERLHSSTALSIDRLIKEVGVQPRLTTRQTLAVWRTGYPGWAEGSIAGGRMSG